MDKFLQSTRTDEQLILEQAARWHLLMQGAPSPEERAAFDTWLMDSRRHVRNYLLVVALERELTQIDPERRIEIDNLQSRTQGDVVQLNPPNTARSASFAENERLSLSSGPTGSRRLPLFTGLAAVLILAVTVAAWWWWLDGRYSTSVGEQRIVKLEDGSVMYLNTRSRAKVEYSRQARNIHLLRGEALFVVASDAARPFRVATGTAVIQAVGTEFNVYRRDAGTAVAVLEGSVQVFADNPATFAPDTSPSQHASDPVRLSAGEEANVEHDGRVAKRKTADISNAVAWRDRRLIFRASALAEIAQEFNRYNSELQFRVEGVDTAARRYSGIFDAYDPKSLMQVLSADKELTLQRTENEVVIRHRSPGRQDE